MEDICVYFLDQVEFFSIPQVTLPWQPILWQNCGKITYPPALIAPAFRSRLGDRNFYFRRVISNHLCTVCRNLVTFSSVTAEFSLLKKTSFSAIRQKSAYHAKYLRISWTYIDLLYRFGRHISGDDFPNIRLAVAQGTLLWQPVKYGRCSQTSRGMTFILCFGIRQRIGRS